MNRVNLSVLCQNSKIGSRKVDIDDLSSVCQPRPFQKGWVSQKFPIYPIQIDFYLSNPPFNKISMSIQSHLKTYMQIFGSGNGKQYFRIQQINPQKDDYDKVNQKDGQIVSKFFKQSHYYNYLRLKIYQPQIGSKSQNICKQVGIRAIQVSNITMFNAQYLCNLRKRLQLHPCIFSILQLLEYKCTLLQKKQQNRLRTLTRDKYIKRMNQLQTLIFKDKLSPTNPNMSIITQLSTQFQVILSQSLYQQQQLDMSNPIELKSQIKQLESQLAGFYVDRLNNLHKNVTDYFVKYWNIQIKDIYLRYLSSPDDQDLIKAQAQFWSQVKQLKEITPSQQQAILMFFNYYLEFISDPIKIGVIKILCLFLKFQSTGFKLYNIYQRILYNLIIGLSKPQDSQIYKCIYKCIFLLYQKIPNSQFLHEFLDKQTHAKLQMKLKKLQILQKLCLNDPQFRVSNKAYLIQLLLQLLQSKQLVIQQKNKCYNIIAYLASHYGKTQLMQDFQPLNSMILMNMQKIIDMKLLVLKTTKPQKPSFQREMCQYCGQNNKQFVDQNIYNIHCYKECRILTNCQYCSLIVQIPQLNKHYLEECTLKNKFKNCDYCNDVIFIGQEPQHNPKCLKNFITKCPLCSTKLESKLRMKQHILKDGCPNNPRNQKQISK